jgi:hypothetical protein
VCYLLALFLGVFGAHLFYAGKWKRGILYLVFCWTYIPMVLGWIDMLFIHKWFREGTNESPKANNHQGDKSEFNAKVINMSSANSHTFYSMNNIILDKYAHLKTPQYILDCLQGLKTNRKKGSRASIEIRISTSNTEFMKDSLKYSNMRGAKAVHKTLVDYQTTFWSLNEGQKKWYFYWRERVLNGEYPNTDLSYIILFTYELINYTFNDSAAFNVSMMERLYENYREREPKAGNYLPRWIHDFLTELGEDELAEAWSSNIENIEDPLYKRIAGSRERLDKISITLWKEYLRGYRETEFFWGNKSKIYDTFKKAIPLLNDIYESQGSSILEDWFEEEEKTWEVHLYGGAVVGRDVKVINNKYTVHRPSKCMYDEITALFRMSENIVRFIAGEKREIKVQSELLPDNFRELLVEKLHTKKPDKKVKDRFTRVQEGREGEGYAGIPAPPEGKKPENVISFNMAEIEMLNRQSEELQNNFRANGYEDEDLEQDSDREAAADKVPEVEKIVEQAVNAFEYDFGSEGEADDFIESLTEAERKYLLVFEGLKISVSDSNAFIKSRGMMAGTFISSINEKANEHLDDNLIEQEGDHYMVYEDYEDIITRIKKGEIYEH